VNKILHTPITRLKSAAAGPEITTLLDTFRRMFNLHQQPKASVESESVEEAQDEGGKPCD